MQTQFAEEFRYYLVYLNQCIDITSETVPNTNAGECTYMYRHNIIHMYTGCTVIKDNVTLLCTRSLDIPVTGFANNTLIVYRLTSLKYSSYNYTITRIHVPPNSLLPLQILHQFLPGQAEAPPTHPTLS